MNVGGKLYFNSVHNDARGDPKNHALCNRESHWNKKI